MRCRKTRMSTEFALARSVPAEPELKPNWNRRRILTAGACFALAGCSNTPALSLARDTMALAGSGDGKQYSRDRAEIDRLPYAQIGVTQGYGSRAILVLASARGEELSWVSANRVQVVTLRNRVVQTTGLRSDIGRTELDGPDLWERYKTNPAGAAGDLLRTIQVEPGRDKPAVVRSTFTVEGEDRIDILGQQVDTMRVREEIDVAEWRWRATNFWWLSRESPFAWRSLQHLTPDQPPLQIEVLKRPS